MKDRLIFDCGRIVAIATPCLGGHLDGEIHLFQVPGPGVAHQFGVTVKGLENLEKLRAAIDHVLPRPRT